MKKTISIITIMIIIAASISAAGFNAYIDISAGYAFRTNAYSNPLPINGDITWLEWTSYHPFISRHDVILAMNTDMFFSEDARTGLSLGINLGFPCKAKTIRPKGNFNSNNWYYQEEDTTDTQHILQSIYLGPIFKVRLEAFDIGMAIRAGLSTMDNYESIMFDIEADPFFNAFITENLYITAGAAFNAHIMRFINDEKKFYESNFSMIDIAPHIGMGIWLR